MLGDLVQLLTGESEIARHVNELKALGDGELADLGIARDQIEEFVRARLAPDADS